MQRTSFDKTIFNDIALWERGWRWGGERNESGEGKARTLFLLQSR